MAELQKEKVGKLDEFIEQNKMDKPEQSRQEILKSQINPPKPE